MGFRAIFIPVAVLESSHNIAHLLPIQDISQVWVEIKLGQSGQTGSVLLSMQIIFTLDCTPLLAPHTSFSYLPFIFLPKIFVSCYLQCVNYGGGRGVNMNSILDSQSSSAACDIVGPEAVGTFVDPTAIEATAPTTITPKSVPATPIKDATQQQTTPPTSNSTTTLPILINNLLKKKQIFIPKPPHCKRGKLKRPKKSTNDYGGAWKALALPANANHLQVESAAMASNNVAVDDVTLLAASLTKEQVKAENKALKLLVTTLKNKINSLESDNKYLKAREMDTRDIQLLKRASIKQSNEATK
jgi:hypothetical protein